MAAIWNFRREALAVAAALWLAGFHFFYDGFYHMAAFWLGVAPLAVANLDGAWQPGGGLWKRWLAGLVAWQLGCGLVRAADAAAVRAWVLDVAGVGVLVVAVLVLRRIGWGWKVLRLTIFAAAVVTAGWSLVRFYPLSGLGLGDERLRNVFVYSIGLNAVLTGLLVGFSMTLGIGLDFRRAWARGVLRLGLAVLGFALMAAQSRGALLATGAALAVLVAVRRREVLADAAACLAGVAGYLLAHAAGAGAPDLVERGAAGRWEIWKTYLGGLDGLDWWIGEGTVPSLDASVLGWFVHHPHGGWLSQLVWCGVPGLILLGGFVAMAVAAGWKIRDEDPVPLACLVFGATALLFDGAQVVSLASVPRIEPLLVLVPALVALAGRDAAARGATG